MMNTIIDCKNKVGGRVVGVQTTIYLRKCVMMNTIIDCKNKVGGRVVGVQTTIYLQKCVS